MTSHPIRDMAGHLSWTESGTVWATWRITSPCQYGRNPLRDKIAAKNVHRLLVRGLQGEALMLGLAVSIDPTSIVRNMIDNLDLAECPAWAEEAEANLDRLEQYALGERVFYLSVPLANVGSQKWREPLETAAGKVLNALAVPRMERRAHEIALRMVQARKIEEAIPRSLKARRVTVTEQVWIAAHQQIRGMQDSLPEVAEEMHAAFGAAPGAEQLTGKKMLRISGSALPKPHLDPGCLSDLKRRREYNPLSRRVIKVTNPAVPDQPPSYQAMLVMASTPPGGVVFPGSELFAQLDDYGPEIDWAIRLQINSRDKVMKANRKATREINDQYEQRDPDGSVGMHDLDLIADLLQDYQQLFANDRLEVEVQHTVILAIGAADMQSANEQADHVIRVLGSEDFQFERPVGSEEELWWAMHPGAPTTATIRGYAQFMPSDHFSYLVPFVTAKLGGSSGPVLFLNTSNQRVSAVHCDLAGVPSLDATGSIVFTGELGAGKSVGLKTCTTYLVDQQGQAFVIDKSADGEWKKLIEALVPDPVVVDPGNPRWSMDPIRIFGDDLDTASMVTNAFLCTLFNISPREHIGLMLKRILTPEALQGNGVRNLYDVIGVLKATGDPEQVELAEQMNSLASLDLGALVFNPDLPPVPGDSAAVVWRTHTMDQPTHEQVITPHLFRELSEQAMFGRAYYRLLTKAFRVWAFADRSRPAGLILDEAYDATRNPENADDIEYIIRQGRRPKALVFTGSHDPDNDWPETLRGLIPTRVAMRHRDKRLAQASVRFLGLDESDPEFAAMVDDLRFRTSPIEDDTVGCPPERRGECFVRDVFNGIGEAKVLPPAKPEHAAAVLSTPPKSRVHLDKEPVA